MKILVTGSKGQLGSELHRLLERTMPSVATYIDRDELDLSDERATDGFLKYHKFTHIINCAAYTAVDRAELDKIECSKANVDIVRNIAKNAEEYGTKIIHISTDYVFDGSLNRPYSEGDKTCPTSQYGSTKRKGETALMGLAPESIIIRTGWLYSTYGHNFVKTMLGLMREGKPIKVVCDQVGTPTYARHLAEAIVQILMSKQWIPGIFNYSGEGVCSWYDFATVIARNAKIEATITPIMTADYPTQATRPPYSVLDKTRIKAVYNIKIPHWMEALDEFFANYPNENE